MFTNTYRNSAPWACLCESGPEIVNYYVMNILFWHREGISQSWNRNYGLIEANVSTVSQLFVHQPNSKTLQLNHKIIMSFVFYNCKDHLEVIYVPCKLQDGKLHSLSSKIIRYLYQLTWV